MNPLLWSHAFIEVMCALMLRCTSVTYGLLCADDMRMDLRTSAMSNALNSITPALQDSSIPSSKKPPTLANTVNRPNSHQSTQPKLSCIHEHKYDERSPTNNKPTAHSPRAGQEQFIAIPPRRSRSGHCPSLPVRPIPPTRQLNIQLPGSIAVHLARLSPELADDGPAPGTRWAGKFSSTAIARDAQFMPIDVRRKPGYRRPELLLLEQTMYAQVSEQRGVVFVLLFFFF